ncbi:MAG: PAS domain S-box protein [Chloroflexi bacterium]|nr:PAS domain S-box protein [Chloroflexota bacterium]
MNDHHPVDADTSLLQDGALAPTRTEQRYRAIVEDQTELVCRYDPNLNLTFGNRAYCKSFGLTPDELIGKSILSKIPPEEREAGIAHIRALTQTNPVAISVHHSLQADGSLRWVEWKDRAIFDEGGQIVEYQAVGRDITEQKRAETELLETQERMRLFIEHAPAAIAMLDTDMRYVAVSRRWLSDYRLGDENIIGRSHYDVFPEIPERWRNIHQRCLKGAVEMSDADRFPRLDGSHDWVRWEIRPWRHTDGRIGGILLFSEVITDRVNARNDLEEAYDALERRVTERTIELERAKERLEAIFNHSGDGILLVDVQQGIQQSNDTFNRMLDLGERSALGLSLLTWVHPDDMARINASLRDAASAQHPQGVEARLRRSDGTFIEVEISIAPINRSVYSVTNLVCIIRDITERKQAETTLKLMLEQEKELVELKTRFVSTASHEFRTPLAAILAATESLSLYRHRMSDEQISERLTRIGQQVGFLQSIMEDVLQLSSFQARKMECRPVVGDVARLCRDLVEEFDAQAEHQGRIRCDCPDTAVLVAYDPRLLRQAVSNLLHNALKYSAGEQPVDLQLSHDEQAIRICVRDAGIGIPPDDIKHIFEPFHRADNVGSISGTGLGLSITKQAIDLHNGTITVESEVGKGTSFTVTFPREPERYSAHDLP